MPVAELPCGERVILLTHGRAALGWGLSEPVHLWQSHPGVQPVEEPTRLAGGAALG